MKAAIYCRISLDREGEGQGVERQKLDCQEYCIQRGWEVVSYYEDNDVSAFSGRKRPGFESMLQADADVVVVWKSDRLARRGKDLQRFLDTGMQLASVTEPEFTGSTGLLMLRILSGFAEHESGVKSERVARKMRQKAERGDPHAGGKRCFGFTADGRHLEPQEAALVREAAQRVISGEPVASIVRDWHARGQGGRWVGTNLSRLLRSPRMAGLREVGGELVQGTFPAILDRQTWEHVNVLLKPRLKRAEARRYLLTGLLVCQRCGSSMVGSGGVYRCPPPARGGCGGQSIREERANEYVTRMALAAIPGHKVDGGAEGQVQLLMDALREAEAAQAQLAKDYYVDKRLPRPAYLAANDDLDIRCHTLRSQIAEYQTGQDLGPLDEVVERWDHLSLADRQAVLRAVLRTVVLIPAEGTRTPAEDRLRLFWTA